MLGVSVIFLLCLSTALTQSPETAHIHINQTINDCQLPDILPIIIHINNEYIECHLYKNTDITIDIPVYILQTSSTGKTVAVRQDTTSDQVNIAYQNKEKNIAVVIKCSLLNDGRSLLELEGSVTYDGKEYIVTKSHRHRRQAQSSNGDDDEDEEYSMHPQTDLPPLNHDFKEPVDQTETRKEIDPFKKIGKINMKLPRHKRDTTTYNIDVVMAIDYSIYTFWYLKSTSINKRNDAISKIRLYYAIVANGINLRYKNIEAEFKINVRLSGLIIAETPSAAPWTENIKQSASPRDEVDSDAVLEAFKDWIATSDSLPLYDHMMLFSRYDLYSVHNGIKSKSTAGLAFIGAVCDTQGQATSVVEDEGGYQCIETAAHELGHSLGAKHDGMTQYCSDSDRYIMTAGSYTSTPSTKTNPWKFSSCSIDYFRERLERIVNTRARGRQCLYNALTVSSTLPTVTNMMPGQLHTPDEICQQIYGPSSRMCKGIEFGETKDVCTALFCLDPSSDGSCFKQVAPRGLSCGDKKWCIDGECQSDFRAPELDDTCPFGDVVGDAFSGSTCEDFIGGYTTYCYQKLVRGRCCSTCEKHYIGVYGCEYGDKGYGCNKDGCGLRDIRGGNYSATCCGTCNYRIPVPDDVKTTTKNTPQPTQIPSQTTSQPQPTCADSKGIIMGDSTCTDLIFYSPELCYTRFMSTSCCKSCRLVRNDNPYCPFGDISTVCSIGWCGIQFENGTYYDEICCKTCNYDGVVPTRPTPIQTSTTLPPSTTSPTPTTPSPTTPTPTPTTSSPTTSTPTPTTPSPTTPTPTRTTSSPTTSTPTPTTSSPTISTTTPTTSLPATSSTTPTTSSPTTSTPTPTTSSPTISTTTPTTSLPTTSSTTPTTHTQASTSLPLTPYSTSSRKTSSPLSPVSSTNPMSSTKSSVTQPIAGTTIDEFGNSAFPTSIVEPSETTVGCEPISDEDMTSCSRHLAEEGIHLCYNTTIFDSCCRICSEKAQNLGAKNQACLYGDKSPENCKKALLAGESCSNIYRDCCESCKNYVQTGDNGAAILSLSWSSLVLLCSVVLLQL